MKSIGIAIICTNAYFVLGVRFVQRFMEFYKGSCAIHFYLFTDTDPTPYIRGISNVHYINTRHNNWVDGTNSKYNSILALENEKLEYIYYFDADTNIDKNFTEEWFLGDLVGGQHYGDQTYMVNEGRPYDRNPESKAYVPVDTKLPEMYYYGAFWGGSKANVISLCRILSGNQIEDRKIPYEPRWNDESYLNRHFHYNPPSSVVLSNKFSFEISNKGGINDMRSASKDITDLKSDMLSRSSNTFNIVGGKLVS